MEIENKDRNRDPEAPDSVYGSWKMKQMTGKQKYKRIEQTNVMIGQKQNAHIVSPFLFR